MNITNFRWYMEFFTPYEAHMRGLKRILASEQSPYQRIEIVETFQYGRCLILDGKMQSTEADEFIYHEALVHPATAIHPNPKRVCLVGGGEGAALREAYKHKTVQHCTMIDIDRKVIEVCAKYLPEWNAGTYRDKRTRLVHQDARKWLKDHKKEQWDVVLVDITEPIEGGPSYLLFTREFYEMVKERMGPDGILVTQAGWTNHTDLTCFTAICQTMKKVFPIVRPFEAVVPGFDNPWGFCLASKSVDPRDFSTEQINRTLRERGVNDLRWYDGDTHVGIQHPAKHLRTAIERERRIIEDKRPLFMPS